MRAIEVADRALGAAERADLQPIVADTLVTKGSALAFVGRAIEGLGLIATGQAVAVANGLNRTALRAASNSASIERTRDPRAAFATSRMGLALARRIGARSVVVVMTGNLAGSGVRTGDWSSALAELEATLTEEVETVDRITLLEATIGIRAMRGDPVGDLLAELSAIGEPSKESVALASILHARASVAFAEGRLGDARVAWQRGAALIAEYLPTSLAAAARAALWSDDATGAAEDLAGLDRSGLHGPALEADRKTIRAGIAALEGRLVDSLALYREALRAWRDLGVAWDEALCAIDMATLLDPSEPDVRVAAEAAREILVRLEARPFIARLDAAMSRPTAATEAAPARADATAEVPASPTL